MAFFILSSPPGIFYILYGNLSFGLIKKVRVQYSSLKSFLWNGAQEPNFHDGKKTRLPPQRVLSHPDCARISPPPPPCWVLREVCNEHVSFSLVFYFIFYFLYIIILLETSGDPLQPSEEKEGKKYKQKMRKRYCNSIFLETLEDLIIILIHCLSKLKIHCIFLYFYVCFF